MFTDPEFIEAKVGNGDVCGKSSSLTKVPDIGLKGAHKVASSRDEGHQSSAILVISDRIFQCIYVSVRHDQDILNKIITTMSQS